MSCASSAPTAGVELARADSDRPPVAQVQGTPTHAEEEAKKAAKGKAATLLAADEARLQQAIAQRLPEGSTWHDWGGAELEPLLAFTEVIDAAWLLKLLNGEVMPEGKGVVPPWQQVPDEAKLSLETLRKTTILGALPVAVLSYGWAAKRHPDPTGALLRRLRPVLEAMADCCERGVYGNLSDKPAAWGIVWDFLSLPQRGYTTTYVPDVLDADGMVIMSKDDRTPYELVRFGKGLKSINVVHDQCSNPGPFCEHGPQGRWST